MQIFSLEKFAESCQKSGLSFTRTKQAIDSWGKEFEGIIGEEIIEKISANGLTTRMHLEEEWFVNKEEF
ncbi:MAG TPA: hypothetical protein PKV66_06625 [Candidatus Pelethenecus sp.]|nr:hypothetical protein [Candidatus Pelethenecus sp.]